MSDARARRTADGAAQLEARREGAGGRSLTTACKRSTGGSPPGGT